MDKPIYALSIKQPWAWLICKGFKDIENRDWPIGRNPNYGLHQSQKANFRIELPQRIYVHAGLSKSEITQETIDFIWSIIKVDGIKEYNKSTLDYGAIIGEVTITGCVTESKSPWFVGKYGFTLIDPILYNNPIPYRGQLGFFKTDIK